MMDGVQRRRSRYFLGSIYKARRSRASKKTKEKQKEEPIKEARLPLDSVAMESSSSFSRSSASASPNTNLDQQPRLTVTQLMQLEVEEKVAQIYRVLNGVSPHSQSLMSELWRDKHVEFLTRGLEQLGPSYHVLDAKIAPSIFPFVFLCFLHLLDLRKDKDGGYGGGPGQLPHLATTYAAVNTLITLGSENALSSINRDNLYKFLLRMKDSSGEIDVRASYTAISVASILNILDYELAKDVGNYILRCQTYEGGIAGEPGSEAHGGYTFCGLATMILINEADRLDLPSLLDWVAFRQGVEGGFQGRTNKLVDGCYSFWQGGVLALMQRLLPIVDMQLMPSSDNGELSSIGSTCSIKSSDLAGQGSGTKIHAMCFYGTILCQSILNLQGKLSDIGFHFVKRHAESVPLFHSTALQQYILLCSQVLEGGFKDKPGKYRDFYHSCYCLSGLSVSQYSWSKDAGASPLPTAVLGPYSNLLEPIHPLYNVVLDGCYKSLDFFSTS
ncbi:Protein farnesyltransferase subunit beta [Cocos nucifera]|uniref:Protein farnesyltransferase subunit beta n=1 Tax=Cocos nucifera TaxID=13894 RepID=A0A8K0IW99_COCNU|nr:Protein farnesyltransferase subunit beta [Cocos nucifera]